MTFSPDASDVYRTHVTKFVPSSGYNEPDLAEIRTLLAAYEAVMNAFTTNGGLIYTTMAAMNAAATTFSEPRSAWQFEAGSEGIYVLNPTTNIWTKVGRLPYDFVIGTDLGAVTANAIQITTDIPVADGMIVAFSLFEATTASPVTVSINGGAALTLKTNRGSNASGLTADMEIWGRYRASDSTLRLLNDQDVSALVAQAESARDQAVAAAATAVQFQPPQAYGAVGDGLAHPLSQFYATLAEAQVDYPFATALTDEIDWAAFQKAANQGNTRLWLDNWRTYRFNRQLVSTVDGFVIDGDKSSIIRPDMAYFTNNTRAGEFSAIGTVIYCHGELTGAYTPLSDVAIRSFKIEGDGTDDRRTMLVVGRNVVDWNATDLEIYNFAVGVGVCGEKITGNSKIRRNVVRDWTSNALYDADPDMNVRIQTSQTTGVAIDDNSINGLRSSGIEIAENRFANLLKGATLLAALGWQTDGINIMNMASSGHHIHGNHAENVGEAIDHFGQYCEIENNRSDNCDAGIKLIHGASYNHVHHNYIKDSKRYSITLRGSTSGGNVQYNDIESNYCYGIQAGADARACLDIGDEVTGYQCTANNFKNNWYHPGAGGLACIRTELNQGTNRSSGDVFAANGSSGYVIGSSVGAINRLQIYNADPLPVARVQMTSDQAISATSTKVLFDLASYSRGITVDTANSRITVLIPGIYKFRAQIRMSSMPTSNEGSLRLQKTGSDLAIKAVYFTSANPQTIDIETTVVMAAGDYMEVVTQWASAPSFTITSSQEFSLFSAEMV